MDMNLCAHQKVYQNSMMMSNPPKKNWICKKCGTKGVTIFGNSSREEETYEDIVRRFESQQKGS